MAAFLGRHSISEQFLSNIRHLRVSCGRCLTIDRTYVDLLRHCTGLKTVFIRLSSYREVRQTFPELVSKLAPLLQALYKLSMTQVYLICGRPFDRRALNCSDEVIESVIRSVSEGENAETVRVNVQSRFHCVRFVCWNKLKNAKGLCQENRKNVGHHCWLE